MTQKKIAFLPWLAIPLVLALLLMQAAPGVGAASASTSWKVIPTPNVAAVNSALNGVSAISSGNAWAVGSAMEHWNGTKWSVVTNPDPGSSLFAIVARTSQDIWAVGVDAHGTLTEHWNGTAWSIISSPNNSAFNNALLSVTAISATNVWAVGYYNKGTPSDLTLTEQWNGTKWSVVNSPNGGTDVNILQSVARIPCTQNAWAVGDYFDTTSNLWKTLAERYS